MTKYTLMKLLGNVSLILGLSAALWFLVWLFTGPGIGTESINFAILYVIPIVSGLLLLKALAWLLVRRWQKE